MRGVTRRRNHMLLIISFSVHDEPCFVFVFRAFTVFTFSFLFGFWLGESNHVLIVASFERCELHWQSRVPPYKGASILPPYRSVFVYRSCKWWIH